MSPFSVALGASGKSMKSSLQLIALGINITLYQSIEIFHSWQDILSNVYNC